VSDSFTPRPLDHSFEEQFAATPAAKLGSDLLSWIQAMMKHKRNAIIVSSSSSAVREALGC
jgi:hypothetical protein